MQKTLLFCRIDARRIRLCEVCEKLFWAESGVDLVTLKDLLGHSRLDMVLRYAHPSEKHRFEAIRKIEEMQTARLSLKKAEVKSIR